MPNDPLQNRSQGRMVDHPAHKEAATKNEDNKNTGLPKKDDEEITDDESKPEDYEKFNVDKVDELEKTKRESQDKE